MKEERLGKTITEQSKDRINLRVVAGKPNQGKLEHFILLPWVRKRASEQARKREK